MSLYNLFKPGELVLFEAGKEPKHYTLPSPVIFACGTDEGIRDGIFCLNMEELGKGAAEIKYNDGTWEFSSFETEADIYISERKITGTDPAVLKDCDTIRFAGKNGSIVLLFHDYDGTDYRWCRITLSEHGDNVTIYNEKALREIAGDPSRENELRNAHQVAIQYKTEQWYVKDINTSRGVFINGKRISEETPLNEYDMVIIGDTCFLYHNGSLVYNEVAAKANKLAISIREKAVYNFFKKKVLLKDINLTIEPGNMVLLLGGSGAGKTTFINAVTGYDKASATIMNGDLNVYDNFKQMKYEIGMVPQQDLLREDDKVEDTLMNAAEMRMPASISREEREKRVAEVLRMFGLEPSKNNLVGKISGGQRKRLSIAVEYIADPSLFILDEPDSGLDGVMARELMTRLRTIADEGKIVIVITHTPDRVIDLFDKVIVLAKSSKRIGQLAFYGTVADARAYFERDTMEQIVKCINNPDEGGEGRADEFIERFAALQLKENG